MNDGMLWFDNDEKRSLYEKIIRAAEYYVVKYGAAPSLCFIHPSLVPERVELTKHYFNLNTAAGELYTLIEIRATNSVLPNHFWLGTEGSSKVG